MTIRCEWLVPCERVLVDAQSGNVTLVDCLDQVNAAFFPSEHPRFAVAAKFRWTGTEPPPEDLTVHYRLVRGSPHAPEEIIAEVEGAWRAGTLRARVNFAFMFLRLVRAEPMELRADHRIGQGDWVIGPSSFVDIAPMDLTPEQRAELRAALLAQGQPVPESLNG